MSTYKALKRDYGEKGTTRHDMTRKKKRSLEARASHGSRLKNKRTGTLIRNLGVLRLFGKNTYYLAETGVVLESVHCLVPFAPAT